MIALCSQFSDGWSLVNISMGECFVERTRTAEDHLVSLWELLEEERMIAHILACSCDRHNFLSISAWRINEFYSLIDFAITLPDGVDVDRLRGGHERCLDRA